MDLKTWMTTSYISSYTFVSCLVIEKQDSSEEYDQLTTQKHRQIGSTMYVI